MTNHGKRNKSKDARLDPWVLARLLAKTLLQEHPETHQRVLGAIRARDIKALSDMSVIHDQEYQDHEMDILLKCRQVACLVTKNEALSDAAACEAAAEAAFLAGEQLCKDTNTRLSKWVESGRWENPITELDHRVARVQEEILHLLGKVSNLTWEHFSRRIRLTNGATEDRTRRRSFPFLKISGKIRAPECARPIVLGFIEENLGVPATQLDFHGVEHNSVVFVPKNWKTFRTIAKEPTHSLPFQLAIDSIFKRKLRRWGIDLSSQSRNQELARLGSLDGSLSTIDLSMASDTLSTMAVALTMPYDWHALLSAFRSSSYKASFGEGRYYKFSSMGNGFTFSLETLIFTALCRAVGSKRYSVYGDDIIIETELVPDLLELLDFFGFKVNKDKSFTSPSSFFRESCGHDYYKGRLVTPFYMRDAPKLSARADVCHVINGLVKVSWPGPLWTELKSLIKTHRLRIVPFQDDTRAGVHISVHDAWRSKKLYTDRRRTRSGTENEMYGFPVFSGYGQSPVTRFTRGWRSYLLWFIQRGKNVALTHDSSGSGGIRLSALRSRDLVSNDATSEVQVRVTFRHQVRRFSPSINAPPATLPLWGEELGVVRG